MSLRGHGNSPTPRRKHACSVADYVEDVDSVASGLPTRPAVIGHSVGGFVVQKCLETHPASAGVLVASVPPARGCWIPATQNEAPPLAPTRRSSPIWVMT
ncbi:MAG TPA: alpha/beta fold hydrolase [Mycobacterium sp.]|uniref:alpha/beta hydrolase n=1 Tax=Mycobacterium sp. TaxID=1785 RepID=UPI002B77A0A3|nr:alpha/beta fold hydrolase [Mycobacterium sp.]HME76259.1 alpha/beta fold hydrolase [Mycobacterium sp.]